VIIRDRTGESSVRGFFKLEYIMRAPVIKGSVQKIHPSRERCIGEVGRSGISQTPPVAIGDIRTVRKRTLRQNEPLFPTVTGLVDGDLGLEIGSGSGAAGERERVVA